MSISSIQNTPASIGIAPFHLPPKRFAFEKWLWFPMFIFVANIRGAFGTLPEKPFSRVCPLAGGSTSQNTTPIWTNAVGQLTLNPDDVEGSYQSYVNAFCVDSKNKLLPNVGSDRFTLSCSLVNSKDRGTFEPKKVDLEGALRDQDTLHDMGFGEVTYGRYQIEANEGLSKLMQIGKSAIASWYPKGTEVTVNKIFWIQAALGGNPDTHLDGDRLARITIPAKEVPFTRNTTWITTDGELVRLKGKGNTPGTFQAVNSEGALKTFSAEDLKEPACYSGMTSLIVPGLIRNYHLMDPEPLPDTSLDCATLDCERLEEKLTVALSPSTLFGSGYLAHRGPIKSLEPNRELLKARNCSALETFRILLSYDYSVSDPNSTFSERTYYRIRRAQLALGESLLEGIGAVLVGTIKLIVTIVQTIHLLLMLPYHLVNGLRRGYEYLYS